MTLSSVLASARFPAAARNPPTAIAAPAAAIATPDTTTTGFKLPGCDGSRPVGIPDAVVCSDQSAGRTAGLVAGHVPLDGSGGNGTADSITRPSLAAGSNFRRI